LKATSVFIISVPMKNLPQRIFKISTYLSHTK